jgi:four helix bundle protein
VKSYRDLDIYRIARELALETHFLTMKLPKYEIYEQGSQVRRSTQSIKDNIVEGYGRRRYKAEFIRFLTFAHSSNDEAINQLEMINEIYFQDNPINDLIDRYNNLGAKLNRFIQYVENHWRA